MAQRTPANEALPAAWTAAALREHLNRRVSRGEFACRAELNAYIVDLGLGQVRNGVDHVTVTTPGGERVRIYLCGPLLRDASELTARERRRDASAVYVRSAACDGGRDRFFVYLIAAVDAQDEVAAYVGSTQQLHRRLAAHFHGRDGTSADLAAWARRHRAGVFAQELLCTSTRSGAIQLEGFVTAELERCGWLLPGVSRWGAARRSAAMVSKSLAHARTSWSPPALQDIHRWNPLSAYKFYA